MRLIKISKGVTNWQMYGSQKPGNEAYRLSYYIIAEIEEYLVHLRSKD